LAETLADDWALIDHITFERLSNVVAEDKARQCSTSHWLHGAQHLTPVADTSDMPLEDTVCSALCKDLSCALVLMVLPIEDILSVVRRPSVFHWRKQLRRSSRRLLGS
jgi:hypothetical protein